MKLWHLIFVLVSLSGLVSAGCNGGIEIVDITDRHVGDDVEIKIYSTVDHLEGLRNLDVDVFNPEDELITHFETQFENDTSRVILYFEVNQFFINGEYEIKARMTVVNYTNLSHTFCEETDRYDFDIVTNRSQYGGSDIKLTIDPKFNWEKKSDSAFVCDDYGICYNLTFEGYAPEGYNITFGSVVMPKENAISINSNFSALIRPGAPLYTYQYLEKLVDQGKAREAEHMNFSLETSEIMGDLRDSIQHWVNLTDILKNESKYFTSESEMCKEKLETYHTQYVDCNTNLEKVEKGKLSYSTGVVLFIIGGVFAVILIVFYAGHRTSKTPEDD